MERFRHFFLFTQNSIDYFSNFIIDMDLPCICTIILLFKSNLITEIQNIHIY